MKKIIIFWVVIVAFLGTYLSAKELIDNKMLNSVLNFTNKDIQVVSVFRGLHGLSYDYKINKDICEKVSSELVNNNKKSAAKMLSNPYNQGFIINILLNKNDDLESNEINIIPQNNESVFVVVKTYDKNGEIKDSWGLSVESPWLSQYISKTERELVAQFPYNPSQQ